MDPPDYSPDKDSVPVITVQTCVCVCVCTDMRIGGRRYCSISSCVSITWLLSEEDVCVWPWGWSRGGKQRWAVFVLMLPHLFLLKKQIYQNVKCKCNRHCVLIGDYFYFILFYLFYVVHQWVFMPCGRCVWVWLKINRSAREAEGTCHSVSLLF